VNNPHRQAVLMLDYPLQIPEVENNRFYSDLYDFPEINTIHTALPWPESNGYITHFLFCFRIQYRQKNIGKIMVFRYLGQ
jgi:hypothetical protein